MEKFSTWRDKGTGISPFLPVDQPSSSFKSYIVNPILLAFKWPSFIVLYLLASFAPKIILRVIARFYLGVSEIDLLIEGIRKLKRADIEKNKLDVGDIVVANFVSPIDIFVLFLVSKVKSLGDIVVIIPHQNSLYSFLAWDLVSLCFQALEDPVQNGKKVIDFQQATKGKLAVVFAEGTASNNKAVLPLQNAVAPLLAAPGSQVKVAIVRYHPGAVSLPVPHKTPFQYVCSLLTLRQVFVKVKLVPVGEKTLKSCKNAFAENGLSSVELGAADKVKFYAYFQNYALTSITNK